MGISTYMDDNEARRKETADEEICLLVNEIEKMCDRRFHVHEYQFQSKRLFRKPKPITLYSIYSHMVHGEYQIINLDGGTDCSIHTLVSRSDVLNYLMGYAGGLERAKRMSRTLEVSE